MKRPPSLQLFDAREEGKGPGTAYGPASAPVRPAQAPSAADLIASTPPVVETPVTQVTGPKVIL